MKKCWLVTVVASLLAGCGPVDGETGPVTEVFGDDQVAGLAVVLSDHQVQVAAGALERGLVSARIQDYARQLGAEQSIERDRLLELAQSQVLHPDESTIEAQSHVTDTSEDLALLQPPDAPVDQIYLADSVHDVTKAVDIYDLTLLPNVTNPALRDELTANRALLQNDEALGRQIAAEGGIVPK